MKSGVVVCAPMLNEVVLDSLDDLVRRCSSCARVGGRGRRGRRVVVAVGLACM